MAALLFSAASAHAQPVPPDAGALRQQIDQVREIPTGPALTPPPSAAPEPKPVLAPANPALSVGVQQFRFSGNSLLDEPHLAAAVAGFTGQTLDFADLQRAADAVTAAYRDAGWLARVWLPEQEISEGVVTLHVTEARFAGVRIEGTPPNWVRPTEVEAYFLAQQIVGEPVRFKSLERALLLADDLPGVTVAGVFAPGTAEGESELILQLEDESRLFGDAALDNQGSRATGSVRRTLNAYMNSPAGSGELLSLNLLATSGTAYARLGATLPVGRDGMRLGLNFSDMDYRVVRGTSSSTGARVTGRSGGLGADLTQPLVRTRSASLYLNAGLERKTFLTRNITGDDSDYASASARVGLSGNWLDGLGAGGASNASVQFTRGRLFDVAAHTQPSKDGLERPFNKLNFSASRQQNLTPSQSLLFTLSGQTTKRTLDSSEKFYLGGPASVRAYPSSELNGERGNLVSAEWRWRPVPLWTASAFVDAGQVEKNAANANPKVKHKLKGAGLGLAWRNESGLNARLIWSRRMGENPQPNAGTDGDGSLEINRLWLSLGLNF